jgi:hypothetical protein
VPTFLPVHTVNWVQTLKAIKAGLLNNRQNANHELCHTPLNGLKAIKAGLLNNTVWAQHGAGDRF